MMPATSHDWREYSSVIAKMAMGDPLVVVEAAPDAEPTLRAAAARQGYQVSASDALVRGFARFTFEPSLRA